MLFLLLLFPAWNQCCARIYDCFLFFNELEILDVRLHELYDHVDKFVIVESVETFRGNPKPYILKKIVKGMRDFQIKSFMLLFMIE